MRSRPLVAPRARSLVFIPLLLLVACTAAAAEEPVTRTFQLQHVPVGNAQAALRAVLDIRKIAMDETRSSLTVSDAQAAVDRVAAFLREIDVPPVLWTAELRITQDGRERALRTLQVQGGEKLNLNFGSQSATQAMLALRLHAERVVEEVLEAAYSVSCHGGTDSRAALEFSEEGREVLRSGDEIQVAAPELRGQREELARLLGVEAPVERLALRVARR